MLLGHRLVGTSFMPTNHHARTHGKKGARGWLRRLLWLSVAAVCFLGLCWAAATRYRAVPFESSPRPSLATLEVDQGDVAVVVTETGVLESSVDDMVKCRVESFLRLPAGGARAGVEPRTAQPSVSKLGGFAGASASRSIPASI